MILIKLIFSFLIFTTCTAIGYFHGQKFDSRLQSLIYLEQCIKILETEIIYGLTPLPEALTNVSLKGKSKVAYLFEEIRKDLISMKRDHIFHSFQSIETELYENLHLEKEDVEVFWGLGKVLGTSDTIDQQKNFKLALKQMEGLISEAKSEKNKNEKLYRSLGVITGIGIIILLI